MRAVVVAAAVENAGGISGDALANISGDIFFDGEWCFFFGDFVGEASAAAAASDSPDTDVTPIARNTAAAAAPCSASCVLSLATRRRPSARRHVSTEIVQE